MTIVKELIKLHDGEIHLESEYEKGSSFTIILPQEKNMLQLHSSEEPNNVINQYDFTLS